MLEAVRDGCHGDEEGTLTMGSEQMTGADGTARPLFSIVMPSYNVAAYIPHAVDAIRAQECADWELIIVDDAATDETGELAERLAAEDPRITVVHHPENRWLSAARNTGMARARGHYLWICDPDDDYSPQLLKTCADSLAEAPAHIVVFGHAQRYFGDDGGFLYDNGISPEPGCYRTADELRRHVLDLEVDTSLGYTWNKVYDLDFVKSMGIEFEDVRLIEDFTFNLALVGRAESMTVLPDQLYIYAKRAQGTLTGAFTANYYELHRRRIQSMRDSLDSWGLLDDDARARLGTLYGRYILSALERNLDERSGLSGSGRREWLQGVFDDPLFDELMPHAEAEEGSALAICLIPLKDKRLRGTLRLARLIHFAKDHFYTLFTRLRSQR